MKKLPLFWKIYIFAVTAVLILFCVFFVVLSAYLRGYENKVQEEKYAEESERTAESERIAKEEFEERDSLENEEVGVISKRSELLSVVSAADSAAAGFVGDSIESSPDQVMTALIASLNEKGVSAISKYLEYSIGKYEKKESVDKYINSAEGEYTYEKVSELEYTLQKGSVEADVILTYGEDDPTGHKAYVLSTVKLSLPLSSYTVETPAGASLTANGIRVEEKPTVKKKSFSSSVPSSFAVPSSAYYTLEGFIYKPSLNATVSGSNCVKINYTDRTVFLTPSSEDYKTELFDKICELSFAYSDYVAGAFKFDTMKRYLYPKTSLYNNLAGFDNRWYYDYDHIVNENAKITYLNAWSDQLISANIEYDQTLRSASDKVNFRIKIKLEVYIGRDSVPEDGNTNGWRLVSVEAYG